MFLSFTRVRGGRPYYRSQYIKGLVGDGDVCEVSSEEGERLLEDYGDSFTEVGKKEADAAKKSKRFRPSVKIEPPPEQEDPEPGFPTQAEEHRARKNETKNKKRLSKKAKKVTKRKKKVARSKKKTSRSTKKK